MGKASIYTLMENATKASCNEERKLVLGRCFILMETIIRASGT